MEEVMQRLERIEKDLAQIRGKEGRGERRDPEIPPPEADQIMGILKQEHGKADRIVSLTTLQKRPDLPTGWNFWYYVSAWAKGAVTIDIAKVSTLMEACSNEMRLEILYEIYKSAKYPKELTAITGLSGGSLYHHLDILTETKIITRDKLGRAVLTGNGEHLADIVFTAIAGIADGHTVVRKDTDPDWAAIEESGSQNSSQD